VYLIGVYMMEIFMDIFSCISSDVGERNSRRIWWILIKNSFASGSSFSLPTPKSFWQLVSGQESQRARKNMTENLNHDDCFGNHDLKLGTSEPKSKISALASIITFAEYVKQSKRDKNNLCSDCLQEFELQSLLKLSMCEAHHIFHLSCFYHYSITSNKCPSC